MPDNTTPDIHAFAFKWQAEIYAKFCRMMGDKVEVYEGMDDNFYFRKPWKVEILKEEKK